MRFQQRVFKRVGNWFLHQDLAWTQFHVKLSLPEKFSSSLKLAHWNPMSFSHLLALVHSTFLLFFCKFCHCFFFSACVSCTYFKASLDEDCKRRSVRKLVRGVAFVFLQTPRHCLFSMLVSCNFFGASWEADYKRRSARKPATGGEDKGCVKACRKRSMGEAKKEGEDWKNTRWPT
jgi:hypothetical protein